jgi:hypothetical protein
LNSAYLQHVRYPPIQARSHAAPLEGPDAVLLVAGDRAVFAAGMVASVTAGDLPAVTWIGRKRARQVKGKMPELCAMRELLALHFSPQSCRVVPPM